MEGRLGDSMTQDVARQVLDTGRNCFLTGPPGAGKSWLLRKFVTEARETRTVAVTASTGIAGTHIGGTTLHSWAGLGVRDEYGTKEIADIARQSWLINSVKATDVLVIDEISMLHRATFEAANAVCKKARRNKLPFGGMQVVLTGDFFQLPPVSKTGIAEFIYDSPAWQELNPAVLYLSGQFRQDDDALLSILEAIRAGDVSEAHVERLTGRMRANLEADVVPTRLHTHNVNVDRVNDTELMKLEGESKRFEMKSNGVAKLVGPLKKSCLAPERLELKVGASVMFVKNNNQEGYINGTLGTVRDFQAGLPVVRTDSGKDIIVKPQTWAAEDGEGASLASITQIPLRLAWAISVHKSQGMSLSAAEIDLSRAFVEGLGYVALSRVTALNGIRLLGMNRRALAVSQTAARIDSELRKASDDVLAGILPERPRSEDPVAITLF